MATFVTVKLVTHEKPALGNLRFGSWKPYLASAIVLPVCFALVYGLTWGVGLAQPDWKLEQFRAMFIAAGVNFPPIPHPEQALLGVFFASLMVAPFFNGLVALGEEISWRGYLLPRLMPLGKVQAYVLLGARHL
jgi:membrane protease YdiL (CAAX protease family)